MMLWCLSAGTAGKCHANSINKSSYWHKLNGIASSTSKTMYLYGCVCVQDYMYSSFNPKKPDPGFYLFFFSSLKTPA